MAEKNKITKEASDLRKLAEQKADQAPENTKLLSPEETQQVIHELRVHQIELEMQNEELRTSQSELAATRARYFDLYELAPLGYCTVSEEGLILEANLTATVLLGVIRGSMVTRPFSQLILKEDQDIFYLHRNQLFKTKKAQSFDLRMLKNDGTMFWANLAATVSEDPASNSIYRIAISDITERKQSEKAIHAASLYTRSLIEASLDPLVTIGLDGKITDVNNSSEQVTGRTRKELIGTDFSDYFTEPEKARSGYKQVFQNGVVYDYPLSIRHTSGKITEVLYNATVYKDEAGKIQGVFAAARDITERKRAEEAFIRVAREWQRTFDSMSESIWILDKNQVVLRSNKAAELYFHRPCTEMVGKHCWEIVHGTAQAIPECPTMRAQKSLNHESAELQIGEDWFAITADPILDVEGRFEGAVHIVANITEHKKAEESLRESEANLKRAQKTAKMGSWIYDLSGRVSWSDELYLIYGVSPETFILNAESFINLIHPDDRTAMQEWIRASIAGEKLGELIFRTILPDGTVRCLCGRGELICNADGRPIHMSGTIQDISERKKVEEERFKLEAQLNQSQKLESIGQLAGGIAHDFNNMLSVIIGYSEIALSNMNDSDPNYSRVQEIIKAGKRSADLTRQLLTFARKQTIAPKVLDLNVTVAGMLNMLQRLIGENIKLIWEPAANLWKVKMDPSQIDQILANLIVNTRDAISGIGKVIIETGNAEIDEAFCKGHLDFAPGKYVVLSVSDNGCGMRKEILEHIFEPFYTTKEVGKGTGLGLATVFGIVKQNNGFIDVYSEPGQGTTLKIYMPWHDSKNGEIGEEYKKPKILKGTETILLVEDETALLQFAKVSLEQLGYTVLPADNPVKAIKLAGEYKEVIHLLMTDVIMPGMNGLDLRNRIISIRPGIHCLFMSGYTAEIIADKGILNKDIDFLQKPFTAEVLSVKVREALA